MKFVGFTRKPPQSSGSEIKDLHFVIKLRDHPTFSSVCRVSADERPDAAVRVPDARLPRAVPLHRRPRPLQRLFRLPRQGGREARPVPLLQDGETEDG